MEEKKLIRLVTDDPQAIFDNSFDSDIVIKRDSEIAFQSCALLRQAVEFELRRLEDGILFQIQEGVLHSISFNINDFALPVTNFENDVIKRSNISTLLLNLKNSCNNSLLTTNSVENGYQIFVNSNSGRFEMDFLKSHVYSFCGATFNSLIPSYINENTRKNIDSIASTAGGINTDVLYCTDGIIPNTAGVPDVNTSFAFSSKPIPFQGAASFKVKINNLDNTIATNNYCTIGFVFNLNAVEGAGTLDVNEIVYAVQIRKANDIQFKAGLLDRFTQVGGASLTNFTNTLGNPIPDNNDEIIYELSGGLFTVSLYRTGSLPILIHSESISLAHLDKLPKYPIIIFQNTKEVISLGRARTHLEQTETKRSGTLNINELGVGPSYDYRTRPSIFVEFNRIEMADFFGFIAAETNIRQDGAIRFIVDANGGAVPPHNVPFDGQLRSNFEFALLSETDNFVIEMLNLDLESYDGFNGSRKSILAVIPVNETTVSILDSKLQYTSPELQFIKINNRSDLLLRNIRARIVSSRFKPILTRGQSMIAFYIKTK